MQSLHIQTLQGRLSLELFSEIVNWGDVQDMGNLAVNLWKYSSKNLDPKLASRTLECMRARSLAYPKFELLLANMSLPQ